MSSVVDSLDGENTIKGSACGEWEVNGPAAQASARNREADSTAASEEDGSLTTDIWLDATGGQDALCWHNGAQGEPVDWLADWEAARRPWPQAPIIPLPSNAASKRAGFLLGLRQLLTEEYPLVVPSIELSCDQSHCMLPATCNAGEDVCWRRLRRHDVVDP